MREVTNRMLVMVCLLSAGFFWPSEARATCFGSQSQLTCHDSLRGNVYNSRTYHPPATSLPRVQKRFGWMPMQSHRIRGNTTVITGHTAGGKRWTTYGKNYGNGDYRIIGSDSRGPVQRTCINGRCF